MTLETPRYNLHHFPSVYEPSEDTFLFLDALEIDREYIEGLHPVLACEVGSGSGIVITALSSILKTSCAYFSTDINICACVATKNTALMNNATIDSVNMNLLTCFNTQFDVILFNPPYVITDSCEIFGTGINCAWAGGKFGREVLDKFLTCLPQYLTKNGVCYMVLLKENRIEEIKDHLWESGFESQLVLERKIPSEHLFVYKFFRSDSS